MHLISFYQIVIFHQLNNGYEPLHKTKTQNTVVYIAF